MVSRAGFTLLGGTEFEYPPGTIMLSNDWWLELQSSRPRGLARPFTLMA